MTPDAQTNLTAGVGILLFALYVAACTPAYIHDRTTGCLYPVGTPESSPDRAMGSCVQWDRAKRYITDEEVRHAP